MGFSVTALNPGCVSEVRGTEEPARVCCTVSFLLLISAPPMEVEALWKAGYAQTNTTHTQDSMGPAIICASGDGS